MRKNNILTIAALMALLGVLLMVLLTGCGNNPGKADSQNTVEAGKNEINNDTANNESLDNEDEIVMEASSNASSHVALGEYKNIVEVPEEEKTVTDEEVNASLQNYLEMYQDYYCDHVDGTVEEGQKVAIKYSITDEKNGTQEYPEMTEHVGENFLFEGVDELILGKNTGDSFEGSFVYPDDYWDVELVGKEATVSGEILYILGNPKYTEVTDEFISEMTNGQYETVEEFKVAERNQLESYAAMNYGYEAIRKLTESSNFTDIDGLVEKELAQLKVEMQDTGDQEPYEVYGYSNEEEYNAWLRELAEHNVKEMLVIYALADALDVGVTDEEIQDYIKQVSIYYGDNEDAVEGLEDDPYIKYSLTTEKVTKALFGLQ